jgi:hypothetical protein
MTDPLARRLGLGQEILGREDLAVEPPTFFDALVTPPQKRERFCAHCGAVCGNMVHGFASFNGEPLCHPNQEDLLDCYKLVQAGHSMPCLSCLADRVTQENVKAMLEAKEQE